MGGATFCADGDGADGSGGRLEVCEERRKEEIAAATPITRTITPTKSNGFTGKDLRGVSSASSSCTVVSWEGWEGFDGWEGWGVGGLGCGTLSVSLKMSSGC